MRPRRAAAGNCGNIRQAGDRGLGITKHISRWELRVSAALVAITAALVAGAGYYGERNEERGLRDLAMTAASSLDAGDVTALARGANCDEFPGKAEFARVRATLARMRQSIPDARFIYL